MKMAGFDAEASLYRTKKCYRGRNMHDILNAPSAVQSAMKTYYFYEDGGKLCAGVEDDEAGLSYVWKYI